MTARTFGAVLGRQLRTSVGKADSRKKLIGAVRAASARLQLADEDRRAIQLEVVGKASMADMTIAEIGQVLDRLNRDRPAPMAHRAHIGKIRALWWTLYWLGALDEPNDAAIDAFVNRQTGIASLRFLDHRKAPSVIEALKSWAARAGVDWPKPIGSADADRRAVVDAIWSKLVDRGEALRGSPVTYLQAALKLGIDDPAWTAAELDAAIKLLGKRLRRHMAKADAQP